MIGALSLGKKAVTFGYKRYGLPGAVVSGGAALAGYVAVRRALQSLSESDDQSIEAAIDAETIKNAIEADGMGAVTDPRTLDEAIDQDELLSNLDVDDIASSVTDEADEFVGDETDDPVGTGD